MAGRHTITIELDDDEYRALEAEAERIGADVESAVHRLLEKLRERGNGEEGPPQDAVARRHALDRLDRAASLAEVARSHVRQPFSEADLLRLIEQARDNGDARR